MSEFAAGGDTAARGDADTVADIARAVAGVADVHPGPFGEVGTHLPGRRVPGVRISNGHIAVHLAVTMGAPIGTTAAAVRDAIVARFPGRAVDVTVEDVTRTASPPSQPAPPHTHTTAATAQLESGGMP